MLGGTRNPLFYVTAMRKLPLSDQSLERISEREYVRIMLF